MFPRKELAEAIAEELGTDREILFPEWLRFCVTKKSTLVLEKPVTPESLEVLQEKPQRLALPAPKETEPEAIVFKEVLEDEINEVLWTLSYSERQVLTLRFWDDLTLQEVGDKLGVIPERVRQIEAKALRKLRHPIRFRKIRDFLFDQG